ncbi:MAG: DUF5947 family protein [Solirubrobacteraceae bacterium]
MSGALRSSRLGRLARGEAADREPEVERCDLCGAPVPADHRHLLDLDSRSVRCACRACSILFDHRAAGGGHYKLIPDRRLNLDGFALDDLTWEELRIPVDMAFFFRSSLDDRVRAFYPSPLGPTESLLGLEAWDALEQANPVLGEMQADVEALLVNRARGARRHLIVPIDDCYRLVAVIRTTWKGLSGGREVWEEIARFFDRLDEQAKTIERS